MGTARLLLALFSLLLAGLCMAEEAQSEPEPPLEVTAPLEAPHGAWVIDRTNSDFGARFFHAFSQAWQEKNSNGAYIITVEEIREPFFGHRIRISVNDRLLAQSVFYPNQAPNLSSLGVRTAEFAYTRLQEMRTTLQESSL